MGLALPRRCWPMLLVQKRQIATVRSRPAATQPAAAKPPATASGLMPAVPAVAATGAAASPLPAIEPPGAAKDAAVLVEMSPASGDEDVLAQLHPLFRAPQPAASGAIS